MFSKLSKITVYFSIIGITIFFSSSQVFAQENASMESASINSVVNKDQTQSRIKEISIRRVLSRYNSPLLISTKTFMQVCTIFEIDCYLLPSITGVESGFGRVFIPGSFNPFGWDGGYEKFSSFDEAIAVVGEGLKKNYIDQGAENLNDIARIYAPPSITWATKVDFFMKEFYNEEVEVRKTLTEL